ncbi:MFS transporter [Streptomyces californicus]
MAAASAASAPGEIRVASPAGRWVVLTTVLGSSMAMLDSTVINVALPRIGADLGTDLAALQWTVNAHATPGLWRVGRHG